MQFIINMEVERYTLATGRDGGHRLHALLEAVGDYLHPWGYPARLAGLGDERGHVGNLTFGLEQGARVPIAIISLVAIGIASDLLTGDLPDRRESRDGAHCHRHGLLITALVIATDAPGQVSSTRAPEGVANFFQSAH